LDLKQTKTWESAMAKFLVQNLSSKNIKLNIEPWADLEVLAPKGKAVFEYIEPAEIEFFVLDDNKAGVTVISDHIKVLTNGGEKTFRPPSGNW
jgi:hypothetical protein